MLNRKILAAFILAGAALAPITSFASGNTDSRPCILKEHRITSVTPYNVEEPAGRAAIKRLRGAEVRVQAEPGLTAEWLELTLARHVVEMRGMSMKDCALDLSDVQVRVDSAGSGFAIPARVEVGDHGFQPSRVRLVGGRQIIFKRTSEGTCATAVVFPDLGIEKPLPLNVDVPVDLPASAQGEIGFQCGMGMYKSKVLAE